MSTTERKRKKNAREDQNPQSEDREKMNKNNFKKRQTEPCTDRQSEKELSPQTD